MTEPARDVQAALAGRPGAAAGCLPPGAGLPRRAGGPAGGPGCRGGGCPGASSTSRCLARAWTPRMCSRCSTSSARPPRSRATARGTSGSSPAATLPAAQAAAWLAAAWDQNAALTVMSPAAARAQCGRAALDCRAARPAGRHRRRLRHRRHDGQRHLPGRRQGRSARQARLGCRRPGPGRRAAGHRGGRRRGARHRPQGAGPGRPRPRPGAALPADGQGRIDPRDLPALSGPALVCLQAGNVNSGASDPFVPLIDWAREQGAWVHVDGAFGLWAAASPATAGQVAGVGEADSWATDAHKWLNTTYDCGIALVRDRGGAAVGDGGVRRLPAARRARRDRCTSPPSRPSAPGARRSGRRWPRSAAMASPSWWTGPAGWPAASPAGCAAAGYEVLNDVVLNQVLVAFGDPQDTDAIIAAVQDEGPAGAARPAGMAAGRCGSASAAGTPPRTTSTGASPPSVPAPGAISASAVAGGHKRAQCSAPAPVGSGR